MFSNGSCVSLFDILDAANASVMFLAEALYKIQKMG